MSHTTSGGTLSLFDAPDERNLVRDLNARLEQENKAYYEGNPLVSDAEFDSQIEELKGLIKAHPEFAEEATVLKTVGTADSTAPLLPLRVPMLSLENKYSYEELCDWADSVQAELGLPQWPAFSLEVKYDGVSQSLEYDGTLVEALTRGKEGASGESSLKQIATSTAVPQKLPEPIKINIRGEAVIAQSTLSALNAEIEAKGGKPYSNPRNLAAGTLKLQDLDEVRRRKLLFAPWDVQIPADGLVLDSAYQRLKMIEAWGFAPYTGRIVTSREELKAAMEEMLPGLQTPDQEIMKDGLVLKVDSHSYRQKLGYGSKFTRYQVCFKPQNQKSDTEILSVQWQVGRQGKLTPVATVAPVILGGVKIERATLNNLTWLQALGVRIGSKVALVRSGDVIPKVVEVLENGPETTEIVPPSFCPECKMAAVTGTDDEEEDTSIAMLCKNPQCPGRLREMLTYIGDRTVLDIDGLGPELATKLVETGMVKNLADLFQFGNELRAAIRAVGQTEATKALLERGFPIALTVRMVDSLEAAKYAPWNRWLAAFCIPMVGRRLGKVISKTLSLQPEDMPRLAGKLQAIKLGTVDGLGEVKLGKVHSYAHDPEWADMLTGLYEEGVRPAAVAGAAGAATGPRPLEGVSFVITGEFESFGTRDQITARLESLGAVAKSGVTKNVTHLLVGLAPGKSKVSKAEQLGIQQYGNDWLAGVLGATD